MVARKFQLVRESIDLRYRTAVDDTTATGQLCNLEAKMRDDIRHGLNRVVDVRPSSRPTYDNRVQLIKVQRTPEFRITSGRNGGGEPEDSRKGGNGGNQVDNGTSIPTLLDKEDVTLVKDDVVEPLCRTEPLKHQTKRVGEHGLRRDENDPSRLCAAYEDPIRDK